MTHYEVLGVPPGASAEEVRKAYVLLAREHHPDHSGDAARMQAINAAWRELGDPVRRARYDDMLGVEPPPWRPYDDGEGDEPDPRLDDSDARRPTAGRVLAVAPVAFLVTGVGALVVGGVVGLRPLMALAFVCLAFAGLLFVFAPIAVVLESRRHDHL